MHVGPHRFPCKICLQGILSRDAQIAKFWADTDVYDNDLDDRQC